MAHISPKRRITCITETEEKQKNGDRVVSLGNCGTVGLVEAPPAERIAQELRLKLRDADGGKIEAFWSVDIQRNQAGEAVPTVTIIADNTGTEEQREAIRQHYVELLDKCESARLAAEEKARQCEERMFRYGEQAKFAQSELDDVIHTRDAAYSTGKKEAAKEMLEMLEAFQTSYDLIGYEVETVGTIAKKFSVAITEKFALEI